MPVYSRFDLDQKRGSLANSLAGGPIPFVRANALEPFVSFLDGLGTPVHGLLRQARVPTSLLEEPEALLPILSSYRFIELAARRERLQEIGILVGQRASAFDLGAYGAALWGTSTVYEYLHNGVRLIGGHSSGTRLWLEADDDVLRVNQYLTGPDSTGRCIADLYTLVLTINTLRQFFGPTWSPVEVRLLAGTEALLGSREVFGDASVIIGQRYTSLAVSRDLMHRRVSRRQAGPGRRDRAGTTASTTIATDFRTSAEQLIVSLLNDGYSGIQTVAEAAGMSPRTLQRRLAEAGVTYAQLVAASRLRIAKDWLQASDMTIAEISSALGYTAATNFARAFRRQTGLSPAAYRRRSGQG